MLSLNQDVCVCASAKPDAKPQCASCSLHWQSAVTGVCKHTEYYVAYMACTYLDAVTAFANTTMDIHVHRPHLCCAQAHGLILPHRGTALAVLPPPCDTRPAVLRTALHSGA